MRHEYGGGSLRPEDVARDPIATLARWLAEAAEAGQREPNAVALGTVAPDGRPTVRMVLLKGLDGRGLSFFTNLESPKSRDIRADPRVALTFWWERLERQVRVEGRCAPVDDAEADAYFAQRPRRSRLGALASQQSEPIESRAVLEQRLAELETRHPEGTDVPRPRDWGGWRVVPSRFEFWQGRRDRLHDRLSVEASGDGWTVRRLSP